MGASVAAAWSRLAPEGIRRRVRPPLGNLAPQYRPRPLRVPESYLRARRPTPGIPSISIVTPVLNGDPFVAEAVASIWSQGYERLEHLIVDGGSTDQTVEEALGSGSPRVLRAPESRQAEAINLGFEQTEGEVVSWLNADDFLLPGSLAYVGRYLRDHPEVDVVYGHRILIDERGRDVGIWITPPHGPDSLRWFDFVPQETAFWRRSALEAAGPLNERYEVAFDWDFLLRLEASGAVIARLPRFLGACRRHRAQKSQVLAERALREVTEIRNLVHGREVPREEARFGARATRARTALAYAIHRARRRSGLGLVEVDRLHRNGQVVARVNGSMIAR